jgi:hypothetical protein
MQGRLEGDKEQSIFIKKTVVISYATEVELIKIGEFCILFSVLRLLWK